MSQGLRPVGLDFLDSAPLRQSRTTVVGLTPGRVFEELTRRPERWPHWLTMARDCRYDGDPPYGVDSVRRMWLRGGIVARETVLAWDEERRFAYRVDGLNVPGVRAFMEEWTLEPTAVGTTQLRWVLAGECSRPVEMLLTASRWVLDGMIDRAPGRMADDS